jgi:hypothetical protein
VRVPPPPFATLRGLAVASRTRPTRDEVTLPRFHQTSRTANKKSWIQPLIERAIADGTFVNITPWDSAESPEELAFLTKIRGRLERANKLYDEELFASVIATWADVADDPLLDPDHDAWRNNTFIRFYLHGALIDLTYSHMKFICADTKTHVQAAYRCARLVLNTRPFSTLKGKGDLSPENAEYANGCYRAFIRNIYKLLERYPPELLDLLEVDSTDADQLADQIERRRVELELIVH